MAEGGRYSESCVHYRLQPRFKSLSCGTENDKIGLEVFENEAHDATNMTKRILNELVFFCCTDFVRKNGYFLKPDIW